MTRDKRRYPRRRIFFDARICFAEAKQAIPCRVCDVSDGGARLEVKSSMALPPLFKLVVAGADKVGRLCSVAWQNGSDIGVIFKRVRGHTVRPEQVRKLS